MIYSFNYSALPRYWKETGLSKKDIMAAFGSSDYVTINKWLDGKVAISIPHILKFCNHFHLPPTCFFADEEGLPQSFKEFYPATDESETDSKTMIYTFSIDYLKQFMADYSLDKRDLLEAFGTNDYVTLNKALEGERPMVTVPLLRLCNYYQIPISNFFVDQNGEICNIEPLQPAEGDLLLPNMPIPEVRERGMGVIETKVAERKPRSAGQVNAINSGEERRLSQLRAYEDIRRKHQIPNEFENNDIPTMSENVLSKLSTLLPFGSITPNGVCGESSMILELARRLSEKEDECVGLKAELVKNKKELELLKRKILILSAETTKGFASLLDNEAPDEI